MRFKTRMMLAIGCVSLLALSIPAFSLPSPRGRHRSTSRHAPLKKKSAQHAAKGHANARAAREERAARLVSMPVAEPPKRPMFGWPALVSEARKYLGTNPTARKRLWCATFMNLVLAKVGYAGTNSDAAKSFAHYGHRISEPQVGAIAVLTRGKRGGHVGVVSGIDKHGNPIIISGNHGHRVGEAIYPRARVIAYVMPTDRGPGTTQVADRGPPSPTGRQPPGPEPASNRRSPNCWRPSRRSRAVRSGRASRGEQARRRGQASRCRRRNRSKRVASCNSSRRPHPPCSSTQPCSKCTHSARRDASARSGACANCSGSRIARRPAPPPRPAPQRQRQVQQQPPGRVANADTGIAGVFGLR